MICPRCGERLVEHYEPGGGHIFYCPLSKCDYFLHDDSEVLRKAPRTLKLKPTDKSKSPNNQEEGV